MGDECLDDNNVNEEIGENKIENSSSEEEDEIEGNCINEEIDEEEDEDPVEIEIDIEDDGDYYHIEKKENKVKSIPKSTTSSNRNSQNLDQNRRISKTSVSRNFQDI